ncbi:MAG: LytTR family DNA-binding domain-containing protein [Bacteroidota bacterium]
MIRALIVDDEKTSRETLTGLLRRYCKNVEILGEADGLATAKKQIADLKPDLVFLDIQMPDGSGFKLLEELPEITFEVCFTTAYDQYAIKAIRYSALDYLLKPINPEDLINAIEKLEKKNKTSDKTNIKVFLENVRSAPKDNPKIVLSTSDGMHVVEVNQIVRCESDDCYTHFFFSDGKKIFVSKTLKDYEDMLSDFNFVRPHKSHLINTKFIKTYLRNEGNIQMSDNTIIPVSRRKREFILEVINNL